jgi:hypothetical protein
VRLRVADEWRVPAVFALVYVGVLAYDAAHRSFWQRAHDTAPIAGALLLLLLVLLLLRRRLAWWALLAFSGVGLVIWVVHVSTRPVTVGWVIGGFVGAVEFGLLVSPSMRRFVRLRGMEVSPAAR